MIKAGLTGGIGSGKSLVAAIISRLGIPVYHADVRSKELLATEEVTQAVMAVFGKEVADGSGQIDRKRLASIVFNDASKLAVLNGILHPRVKQDFQDWCGTHAGAPLVVQEAAILYESGFDVLFDRIIVVDAPAELCISRVMERDHISREMVLQRMQHQWPQEEKNARAGHIIRNDGQQMLLPQVLEVVRELRNL